IGRILVILEGLAMERLCGADEIVDASCLFILLEGEGNCDSAIGLNLRSPESVIDVNGNERHRLDGVVAGELHRTLLAECQRMQEQQSESMACQRIHGAIVQHAFAAPRQETYNWR